MHRNKLRSRKWFEDVQKDLMNQIESMKYLYKNIDSLFESWAMRICTALMANRATSRDRAIDPQPLPKRYEDNVHDPITKGLVKDINGRVYLTTRGALIANNGMRELVDNNMWPPNIE